MSRIDELIRELCPDGVLRMPLSSLGSRNKGTAMTAAKMKTIGGGGPIRVFAAGNTIADVAEDAVPAKDVVRKPSIIVKSRGHIGFTFYERPFTHKAELWSYSIDQPGVDQKFVYYYLLTQVSKLQELARATSVKLPQLGVKDTDTLLIPVPPLEVQREIVRVLDQFTQLEAELEAELEARRRQYEHYRSELFDYSSENVAFKAFTDVGTFSRGGGPQKKDFVESGVGCIHYGQIYTHYGVSASVTNKFVDQAVAIKSKCADSGDVIIAVTSENDDDLARSVAWLGEGSVAVSNHTLIFKSDMDPRFVSHFLRTRQFDAAKRKYISGTKVKSLPLRAFEDIGIPVPPMQEQRRLADTLDKFDALVNDLSVGLPAELAARRKQYEYYRDKLLTFEEAAA